MPYRWGEEKADHRPEVREEKIGPGLALNAGFNGEAEIVATVICGDGYFGENIEQAKAEVLELIKKYNWIYSLPVLHLTPVVMG